MVIKKYNSLKLNINKITKKYKKNSKKSKKQDNLEKKNL